MVEELSRLAYGMGADVFGTSDVSKYVPERFMSTPFALTIGLRLSDPVLDEVKHGPTKLYFHHYRTANAYLDRCALECVMWLQRRGYDALAIPASQTTNTDGIAGDFPHKTAASLAGLGYVGKSALFITREFGPRVRFATVLTNLKLPTHQVLESECGDCDLCVRACPCGAIIGKSFVPDCHRDELVDAALCSRFMKDKFGMIGRGAVCGICAAVCPKGLGLTKLSASGALHRLLFIRGLSILLQKLGKRFITV